MENFIIWALAVVIMIGSAVNSFIKKSKEKEKKDAALRNLQQPPQNSADTAPGGKFVRKSLSELLDELANKRIPEQPQVVSLEEYNGSDTVSMEEYNGSDAVSMEEYNESGTLSFEEGGRVTDSSNNYYNTPAPVSFVHNLPSEMLPEEDSDTLTDILGGEFDLLRAVIEVEILTPRFEKY